MLRVPQRHSPQLRRPVHPGARARHGVLAAVDQPRAVVLQVEPAGGRPVDDGARLRALQHRDLRPRAAARHGRHLLEGHEHLLPLRLRQLQRGVHAHKKHSPLLVAHNLGHSQME